MKKLLLVALMITAVLAVRAEEKRLSLPESTMKKVFTYLTAKPYRESAKLIQEIQRGVRDVKTVKVKKAQIKVASKKAKAKVISKQTDKTKTTK